MAEFNPTVTISHCAHVTDTLGQYDMIISREILRKLGINLHFSTATMHWRDVEVSMKESTCTKEETFNAEEELFVSEETDLDKEQQEKLLMLLQNHEKIFNGALGPWKGPLTR